MVFRHPMIQVCLGFLSPQAAIIDLHGLGAKMSCADRELLGCPVFTNSKRPEKGSQQGGGGLHPTT